MTRCSVCRVELQIEQFGRYETICDTCCPNSKYALQRNGERHSFPIDENDIDVGEYMGRQNANIVQQLDDAIARHR
jgi:hypothetical protein